MCPSCRSLVYGEELRQLSREAESHTQKGDRKAAVEAWTRALDLLPHDAGQARAIQQKLAALDKGSLAVPEGGRTTADKSGGFAASRKGLASLGVAALFLWKFKVVLAFLLTKGKLLFLGLTKASTFYSMLLSVGVYWAAFGWKFALGLVLSIYIHEMGHVASLRHFGIPASPPMFIPGLGAVVRLKQAVLSPVEDARVGLAGPIWGLCAALCAWLVFLATDWPMWAAIARIGAMINLFNLIPIWQLDGGRGFQSLTRRQRWMAVFAVAATWYLTAEGLLVLLLMGAIYQAVARPPAKQPDPVGLAQFVGLVGILGAMCLIEVPLEAAG